MVPVADHEATARLAEQIKAELASGRDTATVPVLASEVAERLPKEHRRPYWNSKIRQVAEAEGLGMVASPSPRLLDAVTASHRLGEAIGHAAAQLRAAGFQLQADDLTETWQALEGDDPDGDIRALPVEPAVGEVVMFVAGQYQGRQVRRDDQDRHRGYGWTVTGSGERLGWLTVLRMAGPEGVRVIRDGGGSDA